MVRSLFDRSGPLPPFRTTERDLAIVRFVARFRFLRQDQIKRLVGGSDDNVGRRTRLLFKHGFLDCPAVQRNQLAHVFEAGNVPLIYGLGLKGARLVAPYEPWLDPKLDWTHKNRHVTAPTLAHTVETAEVMIDLELAAAAAGDLRLIDHHQLFPFMPEETRRPRRNHNPFKLSPTFRLEGSAQVVRQPVVPDRLFSLVMGDLRINAALEYDRGTMPILRRRPHATSSIEGKLLGYWHAWKQELHVKQWGFQSFRVFFVAPSEARLEHMILEQQSKDMAIEGSNLFLFSTPARIKAHGVLGPAWVSGKGKVVSLAREFDERT